MVVTTIADIAGDNAVHILGSAKIRARQIYLTATGGNARIGDAANVGASRGVAIIQNVPFVLQQDAANPMDSYALETVAVYVPSGTTLSVTFVC